MQILNDDLLTNLVEAALKTSQLNETVDIKFDVSDGHLSLWGIVDVISEKDAIEDIVRQVPGIKNIDNNLTVATDRVVADEDIARDIIERMEANPLISTHEIGAKVKKGVVTLVGNADNLTEIYAAIITAQGAQGVKEVTSQIKRNGHNVDDATLRNLVETELSRSLLVSVRDVKTETERGVVTFRGKVDTVDQIRAAIETAYRIKGVKEVRSEKLTARHGENEGDSKLTNEIRNMLGQNGLASIKAFVVNGILFLDGYVYSVDQKHKAMEVLANLKGITGINNAIVIKSH